jgi:hypothetical protein
MSVHTLPRPAVLPALSLACADLDTAREVVLSVISEDDLEAAIEATAVLES